MACFNHTFNVTNWICLYSCLEFLYSELNLLYFSWHRFEFVQCAFPMRRKSSTKSTHKSTESIWLKNKNRFCVQSIAYLCHVQEVLYILFFSHIYTLNITKEHEEKSKSKNGSRNIRVCESDFEFEIKKISFTI